MLKNCLIAVGLTTILSVIADLIKAPGLYWKSDFVFLSLLISGVFIGIPNMVFLLIIHYMKINTEILLRIKKLILEIIVLNVFYFAITKLIFFVPSHYKYNVSPSLTELNIFYGPTFALICAFTFILIILLINKKIFGRYRKET